MGASYKELVTQAGQQGNAFLWRAGTMQNLGALSGDRSSTAVAINDRGQIVGSSDDGHGSYHPVLWQNGKKARSPPSSAAATRSSPGSMPADG